MQASLLPALQQERLNSCRGAALTKAPAVLTCCVSYSWLASKKNPTVMGRPAAFGSIGD